MPGPSSAIVEVTLRDSHGRENGNCLAKKGHIVNGHLYQPVILNLFQRHPVMVDTHSDFFLFSKKLSPSSVKAKAAFFRSIAVLPS